MSTTTKAWIALIFICIAWGTTYLGIKYALEAFPPFLMAGIRQTIAGVLIFAMAFGNKLPKDLSLQNLLRQALIGFLLITMGNGLVSWSESYIPSGIAALICAMMPIVTVMLNLIFSKEEKINRTILLGMLIGFAGVSLNFKDSFGALSNQKYILGIFATFIATSSWAMGSILGKNNSNKVNPIFNSALQVTFGGLFLLLVSPMVDDYSTINLSHTKGMWSMVYLIIVGSVLAYTAYMYTLKHLPIGIVLIYAYINPLVAVLLGWYLASEPLTIYTMLSFVGITAGVYLVRIGYKKAAAKKALFKIDNDSLEKN